MPLYEYICEKDGTKLELLRSMSQADEPVEDPAGKGRIFKRVHSTFAAQGTPGAGSGGRSLPLGGGGGGGCCPCGKSHGGCGSH